MKQPATDTVWELRILFVRAAVFLLLLAAYIALAIHTSAGLEITHTTVTLPGLPEELDGLRIVQITDLHSSWFGEGQRELIDAIESLKPDLIAITGDFIDGIQPDAAPCVALAKGLAPLAPLYWVRGNHEYYLSPDDRHTFEAAVADAGAMLLDNQAVVLQKNGQRWLLAGVDDVTRRRGDLQNELDSEEYDFETERDFMSALQSATPAGDFPLKIILSHQPHYWQPWQQAGYDLALCGHLHGWIARLPQIGGALRLPNPYFPDADAGLYEKQGLNIYISRGLVNRLTWRNVRLNNKPELAVIEVRRK